MAFSFQENIEPYIKRLEELIGLSLKVFLLTAFIVSVLGIYVSTLLFGSHSLRVLKSLQKEKYILKQEITLLKNKNSKLHKQVLEWSDI